MSRRTISILIILLAFWPGLVHAQQDTSAGRHRLDLYGDLDLNATTLTNAFLLDFYQGEYLSDQVRSELSEGLHDHNVAGYHLQAGLQYTYTPAKHRHSRAYTVALEEHEMAELDFRKDFFDLIFFGNAPYTGQFVYFNDMRLNLMSWQQIKVGMSRQFRKSESTHTLSGALGLCIGQRNIRLNVMEASFFTQEYAEFVALDVRFDFHRTDPDRSGFGAFNGYGPSLDLAYQYTDGQHHSLSVACNDLGFISWDRTPDYFARDSTFRFDGFDLDLFNLDGPVFQSNIADSLLGELSGPRRNVAFRSMLPARLALDYQFDFCKRHCTAGLNLQHYLFSLYRPRVEVSFAYRWLLKKWEIALSPRCSYGGYGSWNAGLAIDSKIGRHIIAGLGCSTVDALLFQGNRAGMAAKLRLSYTF